MTRSPSHALEQYDPGQNVYAILRDRSREHSLPHLVIETVLTIAASTVLVLLRPDWWALYMPLIVIACYSTWGLLDRATRSIPNNPLDPLRPVGARAILLRRTVVGVDWIMAVAGTLSALFLLFRVTGYLLGNWIH